MQIKRSNVCDPAGKTVTVFAKLDPPDGLDGPVGWIARPMLAVYVGYPRSFQYSSEEHVLDLAPGPNQCTKLCSWLNAGKLEIAELKAIENGERGGVSRLWV